MTTRPELRRAAPRAQVALGLRLVRPGGRALEGRTLDIGRGGMCVATVRPLGVDELLTFDLDLGPAGEAHRLEGVARVLRQQGMERYALRFEGLAPDGDAALEALVGRLAAPA